MKNESITLQYLTESLISFIQIRLTWFFSNSPVQYDTFDEQNLRHSSLMARERRQWERN